MNRGINLLGKKIQTPITKATERVRLLRIIAIGLLFVVSASSVILFLLIALSPLPTLQKREQDVLKIMSAQHTDMAKLEVTKERLNISSSIINNRSNFAKHLEKVLGKMPAGLSMTAVRMKEKQVSITVTGASFSSLETFLDGLTKASDEKKDFASVTLQEFITSAGQGTFSLKVNLVML